MNDPNPNPSLSDLIDSVLASQLWSATPEQIASASDQVVAQIVNLVSAAVRAEQMRVVRVLKDANEAGMLDDDTAGDLLLRLLAPADDDPAGDDADG